MDTVSTLKVNTWRRVWHRRLACGGESLAGAIGEQRKHTEGFDCRRREDGQVPTSGHLRKCRRYPCTLNGHLRGIWPCSRSPQYMPPSEAEAWSMLGKSSSRGAALSFSKKLFQ